MTVAVIEKEVQVIHCHYYYSDNILMHALVDIGDSFNLTREGRAFRILQSFGGFVYKSSLCPNIASPEV